MAHEVTAPDAAGSTQRRKRSGKIGKGLCWGLVGLCLTGLALESSPVANETGQTAPAQLARLEVGLTVPLPALDAPHEPPAIFAEGYLSAPLDRTLRVASLSIGDGFLSAPLPASELELGRWLLFGSSPTLGSMDPAFRPAPLDRLVGQPSEIECLALNIYFESRGESLEGRRAVGHVTMNRVLDPYFPDTVCAVVRQGALDGRNRGCQFSWWCDGRSDRPVDPRAWADSRDLALAVYWDRSRDPTDGALWFHADYVAPDWAPLLDAGPQIGRHLFYRRHDPARDARDLAARLPWSF